jgi:hypothetical protein
VFAEADRSRGVGRLPRGLLGTLGRLVGGRGRLGGQGRRLGGESGGVGGLLRELPPAPRIGEGALGDAPLLKRLLCFLAQLVRHRR